jgi:hypothetical protein
LIAEVPVVWKEPEGRIPKFQLFSDGIKLGFELLKLRIKLWRQ